MLSFSKWLKAQKGRADAVGECARTLKLERGRHTQKSITEALMTAAGTELKDYANVNAAFAEYEKIKAAVTAAAAK